MKTSQRAKYGNCLFCGRESELTFHHLIPRKLHRRNFFRKNFKKTELQLGVNICRECHNGIHNLYNEMTLFQRFSDPESLQNDPALQRHFEWVSKQRRKF